MRGHISRDRHDPQFLCLVEVLPPHVSRYVGRYYPALSRHELMRPNFMLWDSRREATTPSLCRLL